MAGVTTRLFMGATERKATLLSVIKSAATPGPGIMAIDTE